jgi:hypothetical protein
MQLRKFNCYSDKRHMNMRSYSRIFLILLASISVLNGYSNAVPPYAQTVKNCMSAMNADFLGTGVTTNKGFWDSNLRSVYTSENNSFPGGDISNYAKVNSFYSSLSGKKRITEYEVQYKIVDSTPAFGFLTIGDKVVSGLKAHVILHAKLPNTICCTSNKVYIVVESAYGTVKEIRECVDANNNTKKVCLPDYINKNKLELTPSINLENGKVNLDCNPQEISCGELKVSELARMSKEFINRIEQLVTLPEWNDQVRLAWVRASSQCESVWEHYLKDPKYLQKRNSFNEKLLPFPEPAPEAIAADALLTKHPNNIKDSPKSPSKD